MSDKQTLAETVERLKALYASLADTDAPAAPALARAIEVCERVQQVDPPQFRPHTMASENADVYIAYHDGAKAALAWARGER